MMNLKNNAIFLKMVKEKVKNKLIENNLYEEYIKGIIHTEDINDNAFIPMSYTRIWYFDRNTVEKRLSDPNFTCKRNVYEELGYYEEPAGYSWLVRTLTIAASEKCDIGYIISSFIYSYLYELDKRYIFKSNNFKTLPKYIIDQLKKLAFSELRTISYIGTPYGSTRYLVPWDYDQEEKYINAINSIKKIDDWYNLNTQDLENTIETITTEFSDFIYDIMQSYYKEYYIVAFVFYMNTNSNGVKIGL